MTGNGFSVHNCLLRPESRGVVSLLSKDPKAAPKIVYNFLQSKKDKESIKKGVLWSNNLMRNSPIKDIITEHLDVKD